MLDRDTETCYGHIVAWISSEQCTTPGCTNPRRYKELCMSCYGKKRYAENPKRFKAEAAARRKKPEYKAYAKEYKLRNPDQHRNYNLKPYNITVIEYNELLDNQGGVCAICEQEDRDGRNLAVDHDHQCCAGNGSCGKCIRGLLCKRCNTLLGSVKDDTALLQRAITYLKDTT